MVAIEGYPAPLGLGLIGSSLTQGVALGYPISPRWGWLETSSSSIIFDAYSIPLIYEMLALGVGNECLQCSFCSLRYATALLKCGSACLSCREWVHVAHRDLFIALAVAW